MTAPNETAFQIFSFTCTFKCVPSAEHESQNQAYRKVFFFCLIFILVLDVNRVVASF